MIGNIVKGKSFYNALRYCATKEGSRLLEARDLVRFVVTESRYPARK